MAIKFGDLIENINVDRAVVDLIANNAKGLLFVTDFDSSVANSTNAGVAGIPVEKRAAGSLVLDKTSGKLYCWPGTTNGVIDEEVIAGDPVTPAGWDDVAEATTDWIEIGQIEKRDSILTANISSGPEPINTTFSGTSGSALLAHVNTLRQKINELISNPPRTFGKFVAGQDVVTDADLPVGMSALEIIVRALSEILDYTVTLTSSSTIEFYQESGTTNLTLTCNSPNYNLSSQYAENIEPLSYRLWYREIGNSTWLSVGNDVDFAADDFTSSSSVATKSLTHTWTISNPASFSGLEYMVEIRDNSDESDLVGASGGFITGEPIVAKSNELQIPEGPYATAQGLISQLASNNEVSAADLGQPDGWSHYLRSKGNFGTTVAWTLAPNDANAGPGTVLPITAYNVQVRTNVAGTWGNWGNVTYTATNGHLPSGSGTFTTTRAGSFSWNTAGLDASQVDAAQFRIIYSDANVSNQVCVTDAEIKFRFAIMAGFADVASAAYEPDIANYTFTEAGMEALRLTPGGWPANDPAVPGGYAGAAYGSTMNSGSSFPRLDPNYGYFDSADNPTVNYSAGTNLFSGTNSGSASGKNGIFGWVHNSANAAPAGSPDELLGASNTRLVVAVPDGGSGTHNYGLALVTAFQPDGNPNGSVYTTINITNSFGATKSYVVSAMDSAGSVGSNPARSMLKIQAL